MPSERDLQLHKTMHNAGSTMSFGRIDVHSHLLPGVDDGCENVEESIACAKLMVDNGYTHSFVTPHIWPNFPENIVPKILARCAQLQTALDEASVPLKLMPGGEMNFRAEFLRNTTPDCLLTYGLLGKHALIDMWVDVIPRWLDEQVQWLKDQGLQIILAHPERMRVVQDDPAIVDQFLGAGLQLQGNLQCMNDPPRSGTRRTMEHLLQRGVYTLLGSDLHKLETLNHRMAGLRNTMDFVGEAEVARLTMENPRKLMGM